jgi:ABC-type transporter MlaC component
MLRLVAFVAAMLLSAAPSYAAAPPEAYVSHSEAEFRTLRALPPGSRPAGCARAMDKAFDRAAVAKAVAGALWAGMGPGLRGDLDDAVAERLVAACLELLDRPDEGSAAVKRVRELGGGLVRITVQYEGRNGSGTVLVYTLRPGGVWGWKAVDLFAEGSGVVATLQADFEAALAARGGNVPAAIADLAGKRT